MQYSEPMQILVDEHQVITSVLEAVEAAARRTDDTFDADFFEKALDFFTTFADRCHHAKEEAHLFPMLEAAGVPRDGGPIGCMLGEHEQGRAHIRAAREALQWARKDDAEARRIVASELLAYAAMLRQHIFKENNVLFVMGDQLLTPENKEQLLRKFRTAEHEAVPAGTHEKCLALAKELRAAAGIE
jgi:hemerythrin-like domain-containing protein